MPYTIVMLALRGFSALSDTGKAAVFSEFLPSLQESLLTTIGGGGVVDANTWGDVVLAVFEDSSSAVRFSFGVRRLLRDHRWRNKQLHMLSVRIAIHVADLSRGIDPIRSLARPDSHMFGEGLVFPVRIAPVMEEKTVWVTQAAEAHVRAAIQSSQTRGTLEPAGEFTFPKGDGRQTIYWLGEPGEEKPRLGPHPARLLSTLSLLRLRSLKGIGDYVERFHIFAQRCDDATELKEAFRAYHRSILLAIKLRAASDERVEADVLRLERTGRLRMSLDATDAQHHEWVPSDLSVRLDRRGLIREPGKHGGIAPYCVWMSSSFEGGVVYAPDLHSAGDAIAYRSTAHADPKGIGQYEVVKHVRDLYKPAPMAGKPPYRSLLTVPLMQVVAASGDPRERSRYKCLGVLDITSSSRDAFAVDDFAWGEAIAHAMACLFESYESRRRVLGVMDSSDLLTPQSPVKGGGPTGSAGVRSSLSPDPNFSRRTELTPGQFLAEKHPESVVERVVCLGYYLTHYRNVDKFEAPVLSALNKEAGERADILPHAIHEAVKAGLLRAAGKNAKQTSPLGDRLVDALPDREAARLVLGKAAAKAKSRRRGASRLRGKRGTVQGD